MAGTPAPSSPHASRALLAYAFVLPPRRMPRTSSGICKYAKALAWRHEALRDDEFLCCRGLPAHARQPRAHKARSARRPFARRAPFASTPRAAGCVGRAVSCPRTGSNRRRADARARARRPPGGAVAPGRGGERAELLSVYANSYPRVSELSSRTRASFVLTKLAAHAALAPGALLLHVRQGRRPRRTHCTLPSCRAIVASCACSRSRSTSSGRCYRT